MSLTLLQQALRASWIRETAYRTRFIKGNPAAGQCYATSQVVAHHLPSARIVKGHVWTGRQLEIHFWNVDLARSDYVDLSWEQFPSGSVRRECAFLGESDQQDSAQTVRRCELLLARVAAFLATSPECSPIANDPLNLDEVQGYVHRM